MRLCTVLSQNPCINVCVGQHDVGCPEVRQRQGGAEDHISFMEPVAPPPCPRSLKCSVLGEEQPLESGLSQRAAGMSVAPSQVGQCFAGTQHGIRPVGAASQLSSTRNNTAPRYVCRSCCSAVHCKICSSMRHSHAARAPSAQRSASPRPYALRAQLWHSGPRELWHALFGSLNLSLEPDAFSWAMAFCKPLAGEESASPQR